MLSSKLFSNNYKIKYIQNLWYLKLSIFIKYIQVSKPIIHKAPLSNDETANITGTSVS